MFDDLNQKNNNQPGASKQPINNPIQPVGPTQNNQDKQNRFSQPEPLAAQKKVEDIFSKTDEVDRAGKKKPEVFQPKEPGNIIKNNKNSTGSLSKQKIIIFIIIAIGLIIVVMASFWAINKFFNNSEPNALDNDPIINDEPEDNQEDELGDNQDNQDEPEDNQDNNNVIDSDQDGLSDAEEKELGTDPNNVDSDDDGLFDREEVEIYETDPLDADSDNDGFLDGEEVREGNNPNGTGRLYEIPGIEPGASPISDPQTLDSDQDGLLDIEEDKYGTDIFKVDTDNDKLSDYQEIKIYKTNPLVSDTDEDGYTDGEEVKNGYNPLGEGKL